MITALAYDTDGATEYDTATAAWAATGTTWVRATDTTAEERSVLRETFDIHPLATEDVIDTVRPKTEAYDEYAFVLFKTARLAAGDTVFRDEIETDPVGMFVGDDWLVTLSATPTDAVERVWRTFVEGVTSHHEHGPDVIAYRIIDGIVEGYFDVLNQLEAQIEAVEELVTVTTDADVLESINNVRRDLLSFRKLLWPSREAVSALARGNPAYIRPATEKYYRDVYDHLVQLVELTEERVIESISCCEHLAARVVSSFVVGDCDDHSEAQREEHLRPCMDAASGADGPEAAVLDCIVGPFDLCPAVVRLV